MMIEYCSNIEPQLNLALQSGNLATRQLISVMQSETPPQKQPSVRDIQQRQILSLMGLNVWARRGAPTQSFDDNLIDRLVVQNELAAKQSVVQSQNAPIQGSQIAAEISSVALSTDDTYRGVAPTRNIQSIDTPYSDMQDSAADDSPADELLLNPSPINQVVDPSYLNQSSIDQGTLSQATLNQATLNQATLNQATLNQATANQPVDNPPPIQSGHNTIPAFSLVGAKYKAWVLMVDATVFETPELAKLWDNIVQSLALTTYDISFPFCDNMQDEAIANASLSGFIFSIAKREDTQVALLSALPDGLGDERIVQAPYLVDMFKDGRFKKEFWELIR